MTPHGEATSTTAMTPAERAATFEAYAAENRRRDAELRAVGEDSRAEDSLASLAAEVTITETGAAVAGLKLVWAEVVREEPVSWLVPGFLAMGELTDLSGDPGVGKGCVTASWAARVTAEDTNATVILCSTEDRLSTTRSRLRAEGADLHRVALLDIREAYSLVLPGHATTLEAMIRAIGAKLLVLDPALEFMDPGLDSHKQQDVQQFTAALAGIAHRTGSAVLNVRHLNKSMGSAAIYKAAGSIAFVGRARMALLAAKDKESGGRVLAVVKGNIGRDSHAVAFDLTEKDGAPVVTWGDPVTISADELVNQDPKRHGPAPEKQEAARDFLAALLADGPVAKQEALRKAKAAGVGRTVVYATAKAMGLATCTLDLGPAWRLP
jgi:putative DNA primase/helicase